MVNSITRAVNILKCLADGTDRLSKITEELQLSKSTIHRILESLAASKLVIQDPVTHRYYLGPLILDFASRPMIAHQSLIVNAFEDMRRLRDFTRETVVLHIRIGLERICLEELEGPERIKYTSGKGSISSIHTGSAGKVLLSELEDNELDLLLRNLTLAPVGPNTITDNKTFLAELRKTRKQGYANSFGERIVGSASISVPIRGYVCPVAFSVLGPGNRFSEKRMMSVLKEIQKSAARISNKLTNT